MLSSFIYVSHNFHLHLLVKVQEEIMWKRILGKESMHLMASKEVLYRRNINLLWEHLVKPKPKRRKK